jgi:hypothetical protein
MSFSDAFDIPFMLDDKPLKKLTLRDLGPMLAVETEARRKAARAAISDKLNPIDKLKAFAEADAQEAIPDDLIYKVFTAKGAEEFIDLICKKNSIDPARVIEELPGGEQMLFAGMGCGLLSKSRLMQSFRITIDGLRPPQPKAQVPANPPQAGAENAG